MEQYDEAGRKDFAEKEEFEYNVTVSYLPPKLDEAELAELVKAKIDETGAQGPKDFGRVMKAVMEAAGSRADGSAVSGVVRRLLHE